MPRKAPPSPAPLFILAPPRSFTSVICAMIGQHPEMLGLPEVNLFASDSLAGLSRLWSRRRGFKHGLLRAVAELGLGGQSAQDIDAAAAWLKEQGDGTQTGQLFRDLAEWARPRRLIDKSPIHVYAEGALDRMAAAFPNACYLHLLRHPISTCDSIVALVEEAKDKASRLGIHRKQAPADNGMALIGDMKDPDEWWLRPHLRVRQFLVGIPGKRKMVVRGEEFLTAPDEHLRQIADWLGIDASDDSIEAMKRPEHSPFACLGPLGARFGNDPSFLESPALRPYTPKLVRLDTPLKVSGVGLSAEARRLASDYGYE